MTGQHHAKQWRVCCVALELMVVPMSLITEPTCLHMLLPHYENIQCSNENHHLDIWSMLMQ